MYSAKVATKNILSTFKLFSTINQDAKTSKIFVSRMRIV